MASSGYCCKDDVCAPKSQCSDFGRVGTKACNLLCSLFNVGSLKLDVKTCKDDISLAGVYTNKMSSSSIDGSLESTWKKKNCSLSAKMTSNSKLTFRGICDSQTLPGAKFEFGVNYLPLLARVEPSFIGTYTRRHVTSSFKVSAFPNALCPSVGGCCMNVNDMDAEHSTVFHWNNLVLGLKANSQPFKSLAPNAWAAKCGYVTPGMELMAVVDKDSISSTLYKSLSDNVEIAAEAKYIRSSKTLLTLGSSYVLNNSSKLAMKVDSDSNVETAMEHKLNDNITLILSTKLHGLGTGCCGSSSGPESSRFGVCVKIQS